MAHGATFEGFGLKKWLVRQCKELGLAKPTEVQARCVPAILSGKDCIGCAKTGSGKTLAFALPILQTLSDDPYGIYALVLTPTRELAAQIAEQFRVVGKPMNLRDLCVIGGRDMVLQGRELAARPHVVVATPGRLADHLDSCDTFSLKQIKYLVLDEADRLLDGGFDGQLATIFAALPAKRHRQTLLFSATLSDSMREMAAQEDRAPFVWEARSETATVSELDQRYVLVPNDAKDAYLVQIVRKHLAEEKNEKDLVVVFVKTCKTCQLISMTLNSLGFASSALHSMISQKERSGSLSRFRSRQVRILVATDLASRGLDIPDVQLVLNHNVPAVTKDYVHRVGRTARAGRRGKAVTLVTPHDVQLVKAVEELVGVKMEEFEVDDSDVAEICTQVSVTKREQDIKLSEMDFDERRNVNKRKKLIQEGRDPDLEEARKQKHHRERRKQLRKEQAKKRKLKD